MKRVKQYQLYRLGSVHGLRDLAAYTQDQIEGNLVMGILTLKEFFMLQNKPTPLKGAVEQGRMITERARNLLNKHREGQPLEDGELASFDATIAKFENVLEYELDRQHIYAIEKVGIFDTDDLIERAEDHLPEIVRTRMSDKARNDFRAAGRCLALHLFTASGYHALRALESEARRYHKHALGLTTESEETLGPIIQGLRKQLEREERTKASDNPLGLIIANLTRMNNIYRKPLTHPDMVLSNEEDAREVFNLVTASITMMEKNLMARGLGG